MFWSFGIKIPVSAFYECNDSLSLLVVSTSDGNVYDSDDIVWHWSPGHNTVSVTMTTSDIAFLRKLAEIKRSGQFKISMEQLRRLDTIKQGQFTATITEDEEPMSPKFLTDIQDAEVKN